jgi:acyl-CoA dehydrogenase
MSATSGVSTESTDATDAAEAAVAAITGSANQDMTFSLELTQDQKDIREWVHGFAADVIRPAAHEWDEREETPWPIIQEAAKIGLYGFEGLAQFFADPTGLGLPIVNEELFWGDAGIGMAIMGTALGVAAIFGQGSGEQIGEWIPRCFGTPEDIKVAAFCASEPNAGSDVSNVRTRAKFDEATNEWVINGQKAWATNGGIADVHVVIATVDPELGSRGHAAFVVPMSEAKGISQGTKVSKHGLRASHTADVFLDDCRVPSEYVLGGKEKLDERIARVREGKSAKSQAAMQTFEASRPTVGAQALGIARAAYEYSLEYAKEREQFGKKIIENQSIAFTLARMKMEIDAARLLVWRASWMGRNGHKFENAEGSISKL